MPHSALSVGRWQRPWQAHLDGGTGRVGPPPRPPLARASLAGLGDLDFSFPSRCPLPTPSPAPGEVAPSRGDGGQNVPGGRLGEATHGTPPTPHFSEKFQFPQRDSTVAQSLGG